MSMTILLAGVTLTAVPHFQRHEIADYPAPYQVAVADVNGDGKPDVLALSTQGNRVDWFENPSWREHPIARTERNIDLAAFDFNGDGRPEIALASGFYFDNGDCGGDIQWLKCLSPEGLWQPHPIAIDPVVHRLRWGDLDGDGRDEILTASHEGIHRFDWKQGHWQKVLIAPGAPPMSSAPGAARGSSEVVPVRLHSKRMLLAAIEPWHGHQLVLYAPNEDGTSWKRQILDESLQEGHALLAADFDGDGQDEIVVGWRAGGGGIKLFHLDSDGIFWQAVEIERGVAVEGAVAADITGDGKLDIVVSAGRNNKLIWYENK